MGAARLVWLAALALLTAAPARAQPDGLPTEPMLRINAPSHIAKISRIATDAAERFAVTASDDKTVRVWSLPDGTLQRVIWVPRGEGNLGKAYAVALSPDGGTIAVGGRTSPGADENVYLFDRASGALVRRLPGLSDVVLHLAFSPDGRRLAAALGGAKGIRVFDVADGYRPLPSDGDYGGASYWVDFDRTGRLVSASLDGFVRLYAADRYDRPAVPKVRVPGIGRPWSVAFSPDDRRVAVGDYDSATVAVLRDRDLRPETFPTVTGQQDHEAIGPTRPRNISADSTRLVASSWRGVPASDRPTVPNADTVSNSAVPPRKPPCRRDHEHAHEHGERRHHQHGDGARDRVDSDPPPERLRLRAAPGGREDHEDEHGDGVDLDPAAGGPRRRADEHQERRHGVGLRAHRPHVEGREPGAPGVSRRTPSSPACRRARAARASAGSTTRPAPGRPHRRR